MRESVQDGANGNLLKRSRWCFRFAICFGLACVAFAPGQALAKAEWITAEGQGTPKVGNQALALQFRRDFKLEKLPGSFPIKVSADSRFVLYVNGHRAGMGPARGDLAHWRYEMLDLAPYLRRGANVVAAEVWSDGDSAPLAQITTGETAFFLEGARTLEGGSLDSGSDWRVRVDASRQVTPGRAQLRAQHVGGYYAAGGAETIDASLQAADWNEPTTKVTGWRPAIMARGDLPLPVNLVPDDLAQQSITEAASGTVVRATGISAGRFPAGPIVIPAKSEVKLLLDAGRVLSAYPALTVSGGAGATISVAYTEALYDPSNDQFQQVLAKTGPGGPSFLPRFVDRSTVGNGVVLGLTDTFRPDGSARQRFEPFWWRTWRFVEIRVKTGDQPLTLNAFQTLETHYPFKQVGRFESNDSELNDIWRVGWNTALLDAHETYMDTAYWEQLQYIGDTRLQMLITYTVAGDPRLPVQALEAFDDSRVVEGIPQSAYPSTTKNSIPPFALLWIGSLHDYWMRQPDQTVLKRTLSGARSVLDWYAPYLRDGGILRMTPGWLFVDWRPTLSEMNPQKEERPDSCVITIMYYGALRDAADLETAVGDPAKAAQDLTQAEKVRNGLMSQCWVAERELFADTPTKASFSQHANALAVLYDLVPKDRQRAVLERITLPSGIDAPAGIIPVTYYFAYYLGEALDYAGLGDRYLAMLTPWREMVRRHFTAFPENPDPSRSDTHAWSAHPTAGLLTYVAGIHSVAPGFAKVLIEPHLGNLIRLNAAMAHPRGLIETRYAVSQGKLSAVITLPDGLNGDFAWKGQTSALHGGRNSLELP